MVSVALPNYGYYLVRSREEGKIVPPIHIGNQVRNCPTIEDAIAWIEANGKHELVYDIFNVHTISGTEIKHTMRWSDVANKWIVMVGKVTVL